MSPVGVFFLVTSKILEISSFAEMIGQLGMYFMTVMLGLFIHGFGTIALIFFLVVHKLPYGYIGQMGQVLATAFGTGSRYINYKVLKIGNIPTTIFYLTSQKKMLQTTVFKIIFRTEKSERKRIESHPKKNVILQYKFNSLLWCHSSKSNIFVVALKNEKSEGELRRSSTSE